MEVLRFGYNYFQKIAHPTHYQAHYAYCKNRERMVTGLPPATIEQWKRTSAPVCSVDRTRGKWRLYLNFSSRKGDKAKRKTGPAFDSRQSALEGMLAFRISWEYSHRGQPWVATEDHVVPRLGSGAVDTTLPAGKNTQLRRCTILTILIWTAAQQQHACGQQQHAFISCICLKYGWRWQQRWNRLQTRLHLCTVYSVHTPSVFFFLQGLFPPHKTPQPRVQSVQNGTSTCTASAVAITYLDHCILCAAKYEKHVGCSHRIDTSSIYMNSLTYMILSRSHQPLAQGNRSTASGTSAPRRKGSSSDSGWTALARPVQSSRRGRYL